MSYKHNSSTRRYLTEDAAKQLVTSCVLSRLDYCSSLWALPALLFNRCRKYKILLHALFSEHPAIKTAHLSCSNSTGSQFLNEQNTKLLACVITGFAPSYLSEVLHLYSPSRSPRSSSDTRSSNSNASAAELMAFALSHTSAPTSGTSSPKTSGSLLLSLLSKANSRNFSFRIFQLSNIVLHP